MRAESESKMAKDTKKAAGARKGEKTTKKNAASVTAAQPASPAEVKFEGPLPGHETQSDEMNCPACGRFVGAVTKCPYCGAKVAKRLSLVVVRWAAVLLSTVGLFFLYLMARSHEPDEIHIADIEPTMNYGIVRLTGQVKANARVNKNNGLSFWVNDGTGELIIFVDAALREEMEEQGLVPKKGNEISFLAQLTIKTDKVNGQLRSISPDSFTLSAGDGEAPGKPEKASDIEEDWGIAPAAAKAAKTHAGKVTPLADVTTAMDGKFVTLEGVVASLTPPPADSPKRPYFLKLTEGDTSVTIKLWQDAYDAIPDKNVLVGSKVRLRAQVGQYLGKLDLKLVSPSQFERLGEGEAADAPDVPAEAAAPKRDFSRGRSTKATYLTLPEVTPDKEGQSVTVRARVESVVAPKEGTKQPYSIYLREGDTKLRASCFPKAWDVIDEANRPRPDAVFELTGTVEVYQDTPQLQVKSGYKVKLVDDTPASQPGVDASAAISVADVTLDRKGDFVVLKGKLGASESMKAGVKYTLSDASGSVPVVFWNSSVSEAILAQLEEGVEVAVKGEVSEFEGKPQVTADRGQSVLVLSPAQP
ncbi:MAG: OB-fold nucleic acid binding domain-containing protein [Kiritimatiellae bacterium]|nr:OB-fold nucleic acid binding domain-containing protein [Kiritimatiellia bacterium]